ncbi:sulfite exporter TauE/SafE family protein [Tropicibacter naphthalenivorans]|uniref:Probable membrane transporter protein n=1 Tax=Tropicibacter naphthalenivorans TaxID=441103 RepID=A0A0P1GLE7_9RHOB|nr:sulfite exporter TauE/SafE family protein [Tropicibacter naphthalenivorans]CUH76694.1 Sulfite exporter TauE/SafE [Tropicibacter naphthalenivorans]SMC63794.1 hypothetical protein SAMN04488093_102545 [Tropicibacter naphthalenivorans]
MPEIWSSLSPVGLGWIALAAFVGGLVRGFSGFGTALVFLPVTAQFLPPFAAIICLTSMDILGPLPLLRRAWGQAARPDLLRLSLAMGLALPLGLWVLGQVSPDIYRTAISLLSLAMLGILSLGLRYQGDIRPRAVLGIGGAAGFLGGVAGLPGPPVILFYMARPLPTTVIRATILLFLFVFDVVILGWMGVFGRLELAWVALGLAMAAPAIAGNWLGGRLFDPEKERLYRGVAYGLIAVSALSGLPIW